MPANCRRGKSAVRARQYWRDLCPHSLDAAIPWCIDRKKKIIEEKTVMTNFRNRKRTMIMAEQGTQVHSEDVRVGVSFRL